MAFYLSFSIFHLSFSIFHWPFVIGFSAGLIGNDNCESEIGTPHRRLFVKASCEVMTKAIDSTRGMETGATEAAPEAYLAALAASLADLESV
jgi:hypothetical protein